jgi:hypothetical protein
MQTNHHYKPYTNLSLNVYPANGRVLSCWTICQSCSSSASQHRRSLVLSVPCWHSHERYALPVLSMNTTANSIIARDNTPYPYPLGFPHLAKRNTFPPTNHSGPGPPTSFDTTRRERLVADRRVAHRSKRCRHRRSKFPLFALPLSLLTGIAVQISSHPLTPLPIDAKTMSSCTVPTIPRAKPLQYRMDDSGVKTFAKGTGEGYL